MKWHKKQRCIVLFHSMNESGAGLEKTVDDGIFSKMN